MRRNLRFESFFGELKRRHVFRVAVGYAAVAFAAISVASDFLPALGLSDRLVTVVAWALVLGFPVAVVLAWIYDFTPRGVRREQPLEASGPSATAGDAPSAAGRRAAATPHERSAAAAAVSPLARRVDSRAAGFIGVGMVIALVSVGTLSRFDALPLPGAIGGPPSIAVLPFENVSGDPSDDFFSDGFHEEVLTQLYKLGGMTVISRTSVMQYRGASRSIREVAEELGVRNVLEASVRRAGNRVRVDARLIDASTEHQLWAERYDREIRDVLALQADIAQQIADALSARLSSTARTQLAAIRSRSVDPAMYELYLQGLYHSGEGRHAEAIAAFRAALEVDPEYAPAYAGIARSHYSLAFFGELPPGEAFGAIEEAASRALELDPNLADAYATLALQRLHYDWDWREADRLFRRALELSPNHAQVRHDYAHYLLAVGRIGDSVEASRRASELDPGNMMLMACAGWHGFTDHEYDAAVQAAMRALMMMPEAFWPEMILGWAYQHKGMYGQAIASLRSSVAHSGGTPFALASLGHALAAAGERTPARAVLQQLLDAAEERYVSAYDVAVVQAGLGDVDESLAWLRRAHAERSAMLVNVGWDPRFDDLRKDRRFLAIVDDMDLPDRPPPKPKPPQDGPVRGM